MIPRAKKNLHECVYHFDKMIKAEYLEEFEINFAAFVSSTRSVTFILQKEYKDTPGFLEWYGDPVSYKDGKWIGKNEEPKGTKIYQMTRDELCKFFVNLRNRIVKEGINGFVYSTHITSFNSDSDLIDRPAKSAIQISSNGIFYLIEEGTAQEDRIPAKTRVPIITKVFIDDAPATHLGINILDVEKDIISLSEKYYEYLRSLVEEWTGMINKT